MLHTKKQKKHKRKPKPIGMVMITCSVAIDTHAFASSTTIFLNKTLAMDINGANQSIFSIIHCVIVVVYDCTLVLVLVILKYISNVIIPDDCVYVWQCKIPQISSIHVYFDKFMRYVLFNQLFNMYYHSVFVSTKIMTFVVFFCLCFFSFSGFFSHLLFFLLVLMLGFFISYCFDPCGCYFICFAYRSLVCNENGLTGLNLGG